MQHYQSEEMILLIEQDIINVASLLKEFIKEFYSELLSWQNRAKLLEFRTFASDFPLKIDQTKRK
jgi:hypothetical protein